MKITIFGLAITSSWGNGHATTFRALCSELHRRGHNIVFFEKNVEWYASNRDMPHPAFAKVHIYEEWRNALPLARRELADSDIAIVGSYFPDGVAAIEEVLESRVAVKAFYDIDTPITMAELREKGTTDYLRSNQIPGFDLFFSFTGGPVLRELETRFSAQRAVPLYCSFDPEKYKKLPVNPRFACDMSYMGTYAPDRQPKIEQLLCEPARRLLQQNFIVAGPQYPKEMRWPANVEHIFHLEPKYHPELYSSSRITLNVTRRDMVMAGYSPSVRLFEAAACGAAIVSDNWPGLDTFFVPGEEILVASSAEESVRYLDGYSEAQLRRIGEAAQARVTSEHTSSKRADEFEAKLSEVGSIAARTA